MQPPPDGSYPGSQGPYEPQGQPPGYQPPGGGYSYPPQGPPQNPQQGYQPGAYPSGPNYPAPGGYGYPPPPPPRGMASRGWFWITLAGVVVVAAVVISVLVTSGGGGATPVGQGTGSPHTGSSTTSDSSSKPAPTRTSSSSTATGGDIGQTFEAKGIQPGEKLALTLVAVDQGARSTDSYEKPSSGMHYVATEIRVHDIGSTQYDDAVNNCVSVYDASNTKYQTTFVESLSSGKTFDEVTLSPGQSAQGWSVFEVPIGTTISSVTYTPDSAIAPNTVQWKLG